MERRFPSRRSVAIGAFGLAVGLVLPLISEPGAGAQPAPRFIVYGTAADTSVTVFRQALPDGSPEGDLAVVASTGDKGNGLFKERLFLFARDGRQLGQEPRLRQRHPLRRRRLNQNPEATNDHATAGRPRGRPAMLCC